MLAGTHTSLPRLAALPADDRRTFFVDEVVRCIDSALELPDEAYDRFSASFDDLYARRESAEEYSGLLVHLRSALLKADKSWTTVIPVVEGIVALHVDNVRMYTPASWGPQPASFYARGDGVRRFRSSSSGGGGAGAGAGPGGGDAGGSGGGGGGSGRLRSRATAPADGALPAPLPALTERAPADNQADDGLSAHLISSQASPTS